jgi:hypothetical protein
MSFPQVVQSSTEILEGQEIFRLKTPLVSSGDVYEMDTSAKAFAIGPDSDVSHVRLTYFDPSQPNRSESLVVSVDSPFLGRVDALASEQYPVLLASAKILVSLEELVNLTWAPDLTSIGYSSIIPPTLDLVCYLATPPVVPLRRADKFFRGRVGFTTDRSVLGIPIYGRRYVSVNVGRYYTDAGPPQMSLQGYNLITDAYGVVREQFKSAVAPTNIVESTAGIGDGASTTLEYRASLHGYYDYLLVNFAAGADNTRNPATENALYYVIRVSDKES